MKIRLPRKRRLYARWGVFLLFLVWIFLFSYWIQIKSYPSVTAMAQSKVNQRLNETILCFTAQNNTYDSFVKIQYGSDQKIQTIRADIGAINQFKSDFLRFFLDAESESGRLDFEIPIGNLCEHPLFYGKGPRFTVTILPCNTMSATVRDSFVGAGVNQTLHSVYLDITAQTEILSAAGTQVYSFSDTILLSQTLIIGEVPSVYLQNGLLGEQAN